MNGHKVYLSACMELYDGEIVAYRMARRPVFELVSSTLEAALSRTKCADELIVHSDQGWHYKMQPYRAMLARRGVKQSMSRKGNCFDNAPARADAPPFLDLEWLGQEVVRAAIQRRHALVQRVARGEHKDGQAHCARAFLGPIAFENSRRDARDAPPLWSEDARGNTASTLLALPAGTLCRYSPPQVAHLAAARS